jgi:hypothetical protein
VAGVQLPCSKDKDSLRFFLLVIGKKLREYTILQMLIPICISLLQWQRVHSILVSERTSITRHFSASASSVSKEGFMVMHLYENFTLV